MRDLVRRLPGEGITILLSSHLLNEVEDLCNRVAIIRKGSIVYEGPLNELLATAATGYRLRVTDPERARVVLLSPTRSRRSRSARGHFASPRTRTRLRARRSPWARHASAVQGADPGDGRKPRRALPRADGWRIVGPRPRGSRRVTAAVAKVYRWEIAKLLAQKRTYLGLGTAMAVPLIFVVVLVLQTGGPNDVPLGRYIRDTGLATPFVVLFFMSIWGFPLITALVAGDIVSSESRKTAR